MRASFTAWTGESILPRMEGTRFLFLPLLILALAAAGDAFGLQAPNSKSNVTEMTFTKGDTREGSQVKLRFVGDSVYYHRTEYHASKARETYQAIRINAARQGALKRVLGELPRYRVFGSCWGEGMRYYLLDTPEGKFYRSLPESSGGCYSDEPGILSLFDDIDTLLEPPLDEDFEENLS
jgi:hypothetical protein